MFKVYYFTENLEEKVVFEGSYEECISWAKNSKEYEDEILWVIKKS